MTLMNISFEPQVTAEEFCAKTNIRLTEPFPSLTHSHNSSNSSGPASAMVQQQHHGHAHSKKAPPSPSLNSQAGSVISFSMQPNEQRLVPLERDQISEQLRDAERIRYAAYRAAAKLEILQAGLKLDNIRFGIVCNIFHHHGLTAAENDVVLDASEASDIVSDIFFAASKGRGYHAPPMDVEALTSAALKYAFLIYDNKGTGGVLVKSLKVFFVLLCNGRLRDKFLYLFRQFEDSSNSVSKKALLSMLKTVAHFAEFFGEAISFGLSLAEGSVNQCFAQFSGTSSTGPISGLTEDVFTRWLLQEPQIMVWLPTHFRMVSARGIRHGLRCSHCKIEDITGMRYQCLRCLNYDLCQNCFFHGNRSHHHKLEHPMQEYCYRSTKKDATKAFLKLLINKLRKRKLSQMRQRYLSPQSKPTGRRTSAKASNKNSDNSDDSSGFHSENSSEQGERNRSPAASADRVNHDLVHPDTVDEVSPSEETLSSGSVADKLEHTVVRQDEDGKIVSQHQKMFDSIVLHMEEHNNGIFEKLRTERKDGKEDDEDCVAMQIQLNRLKTLMDQIFCANPVAPSSSSNANSNSLKTLDRQSLSLNDPSVIISTPMVRNGCRRSLIPIESHFSPIARKQRTGEQPLPSAAMASSGQDNRPHLPPSNLPSLTVEQLQQSLALGEGEEGSGLPSLTDMSMADLTSLLMKTGKLLPPESDIAALDHLNITEQLVGNPESKGQDEDTMEALETLMLKLDRVFKGFHDPGLLRTTFDQDPLGIGNIVGDIGDQIHGFSYQFRQDHDL